MTSFIQSWYFRIKRCRLPPAVAQRSHAQLATGRADQAQQKTRVGYDGVGQRCHTVRGAARPPPYVVFHDSTLAAMAAFLEVIRGHEGVMVICHPPLAGGSPKDADPLRAQAHVES